MPAYLKLGDIKGNVQDARYKGWIAAESVQLPQNAAATGMSGSRGKQFHSDVTVTMASRSPNPVILRAALEGGHFSPTIIVFDHRGADGAMGLKLEDVMISGHQFSSGQGDRPTESMTLNFSSMTFVTGAELKALIDSSASPRSRRRR
jgi:type VI protein secretion system component Hcp